MLDCLVLGYHELDFGLHRRMAESKGTSSVEYQSFQRDQLQIDGEHLPYLDVISKFVNERSEQNGREGEQWYHLGEVPNLAAVYLTSFLRKRGHRAEFVSFVPGEKAELIHYLTTDRPAVVAITTTFYITPMPVVEVVNLVRQYHPSACIVVGGPLVNNLCGDYNSVQLQTVLSGIGADVFVREGQGEATLDKIVRAVISGRGLRGISNAYVRDGKLLRVGPVEPEDNSLEDGCIDWTSFDRGQIGDTAQLRTARSCAFKCSFCDYPLRAGKLTLTELDAVEGELRKMADVGVKNVIFIDDTFNVPEKRFRKLLEMMIRNDFGFSWYSYFRCSNVQERSTFDLMKESGCAGVFLGIESTDPVVLKNMNKLATVDQYRRGIAELNERGIASFASMIVGFPGETEESVGRTVDFLNAERPTFYRAEPFWYNPRSPVRKKQDEFGLEGVGYRWRHKTMTVEGACAGAKLIFEEVRNAAWMPMYMFDFWAMPYLIGKGMSLSQLVEFHQRAQAAMREQAASAGDATRRKAHGSRLQELREFFGGVKLSPAKYRRASIQQGGASRKRGAGRVEAQSETLGAGE